MGHTISALLPRKKVSLTAVVINSWFEKSMEADIIHVIRPVLQLSIKPIYPYINLVINTVSYRLSNILLYYTDTF